MSKSHHDGRPEDYYEQTYRQWRESVEEKKRQRRPDDYYARTYWTWRTAVNEGRRQRSRPKDTAPPLPLAARLRRRYASRRWLLAVDLLLVLALSQALIVVGVRTGAFQNFGTVPHSMDEAADSAYRRDLNRQMERERREWERRSIGRDTR